MASCALSGFSSLSICLASSCDILGAPERPERIEIKRCSGIFVLHAFRRIHSCRRPVKHSCRVTISGSYGAWCKQAEEDQLDFTFLPGMKLGKSIEGEGVELLYKPHMDFLWSSLVSGASGLKCKHLDSELRFKKGNKGRQGAEVHNWLLCSSRLRRIRLTYFDAGSAGQAFNSVLYPDYRYDFPLLGIDLLSFGRRKILCVVDFQPLSQDPNYLERYTAGLAPIRQQFAEHCSHMTTRIYNENKFFSKQLIFFRSNRGAVDSALQMPNGSFFKVYKAYVKSYLNWLLLLDPQDDPAFMASVQRGQAGYDKYSAERDPAIRLFSAYFGQKWSEQVTDYFLFPLARDFDSVGVYY